MGQRNKTFIWILVFDNSNLRIAFYILMESCFICLEWMDLHCLNQSCSIKNDTGVISSTSINKFVQKCQCYYTLLDQSIPMVTIASIVSLRIEQLWWCFRKKDLSWNKDFATIGSQMTSTSCLTRLSHWSLNMMASHDCFILWDHRIEKLPMVGG